MSADITKLRALKISSSPEEVWLQMSLPTDFTTIDKFSVVQHGDTSKRTGWSREF